MEGWLMVRQWGKVSGRPDVGRFYDAEEGAKQIEKKVGFKRKSWR